jgi:hypothetical protein
MTYDEFVESEHPRDKGGKFANKGSGGGGLFSKLFGGGGGEVKAPAPSHSSGTPGVERITIPGAGEAWKRIRERRANQPEPAPGRLSTTPMRNLSEPFAIRPGERRQEPMGTIRNTPNADPLSIGSSFWHTTASARVFR